LVVAVVIDAVETRSDFRHAGSSKILGHEFLLLVHLGSPLLTGNLAIAVRVERVPKVSEGLLAFLGFEHSREGCGDREGGPGRHDELSQQKRYHSIVEWMTGEKEYIGMRVVW